MVFATMNVIFVLILASLAVATLFVIGFIWAVRSGQFEDTCTPSMRILAEEEQGNSGTRKREGTTDD